MYPSHFDYCSAQIYFIAFIRAGTISFPLNHPDLTDKERVHAYTVVAMDIPRASFCFFSKC